MKERTTLQRYADYKRTFPKRINARRVELIEKMHARFTPEESARRFDQNPGWKEECDRREYANLTDAERAELAECNRIVDAWQAAAPWTIDQDAFIAEKEARIQAILDRVKGECPGRGRG